MMRPIEDFCCQNIECPERGIRGRGNLKFEGWSGHKKAIRMIRCRTCRGRFSERTGTALAGSKLPLDKTLAVLDHLREGCGTLSTARLVGVGKNTVTRYLRLAGEQGRKLHDELVAFSPSHPSRADG
jgi:LacI family transcriptional regulator